MFDHSDSLKELCDQNLLREMAPLGPLGEKVADRPDEWAFVGGIAPRRPPHPGCFPKFCENAAMRTHAISAKNRAAGTTWRCPAKKSDA